MNILVTGGAGYIGSHTTRLLIERGHAVTVLDSLVYGHRAAVPADRLVVGDIGDSALVGELLRSKRIDAIVHFAAFAYVGESVTDPAKYYQNNLVGSLALLVSARDAGIERFVFSSTCATYGEPDAMPIVESQAQRPINPYGRSKLAFEWALADFAHAYGIGYAALRYFNAAGASPAGDIGEDHHPETHLLPLLFQVALGQRSHVDVFGSDYPTPDGTCVRDYIHVDDLASAHAAALEKIEPSKGLKLNLGTGRGYSVKEAVAVCEAATGKRIATRLAPRRAGDPPELVAAAGAAKAALGWEAEYKDLEKIAATAWKWHSAHPKGYDDRK